jgi:hypothetical protein
MKKILLNICFIVLLILCIVSLTAKSIITESVSYNYAKERIIGNIIGEVNERISLNSNQIDEIRNVLNNSKYIDNISIKIFENVAEYYAYMHNLKHIADQQKLQMQRIIELENICISTYIKVFCFVCHLVEATAQYRLEQRNRAIFSAYCVELIYAF